MWFSMRFTVIRRTALSLSALIIMITLLIAAVSLNGVTAAPSVAITATAASTTDPFVGLSIPELAARTYGGGQVIADNALNHEVGFTRYVMHYPSDGLTIYGFMDVPIAPPRTSAGYPVIIAIHGYIDPRIYQTIDYTTGYADTLANAGYIVLHPNLRNYFPSSSGPNLLRVGYAIDALNLAAIVRVQGGQPGILQQANPKAIGLWGHSMGGGVSIRTMTVDPLIKAVVLYAPISGDDTLNAKQYGKRPGQYDMVVPADVYQRTSPIYFYDRIQAPVSIHQGLSDTTVPPAWTADLCSRLQTLQKSVECFTYPKQTHIFTGTSDQLFRQRMVAFFDAHLQPGI
jgi:dipeptidyl aminopeptidase/acylaminoacyl peptidase